MVVDFVFLYRVKKKKKSSAFSYTCEKHICVTPHEIMRLKVLHELF